MKKQKPAMYDSSAYKKGHQSLVLWGYDDPDLPELEIVVPWQSLRRLANDSKIRGQKKVDVLEKVFVRGIHDGASKPYLAPDLLEAWGMARVFDFLKQGPTWKLKSKDADLAEFYPLIRWPDLPRLEGGEMKNRAWIERLTKDTNDRIRGLGILSSEVEIRFDCPYATKDHAACGRVFAHTLHEPNTVCLDPSILTLPPRFLTGILLHEFGHLLAEAEWNDDSEEAADLAVKMFLGAELGYESPWWLQSFSPKAWEATHSPKRQENPSYPALPIGLARPFVIQMEEEGVSEVARSDRGFWSQYSFVAGHLERLSPWWQRRRENFLKRHLAQIKKNKEPLYRTVEGKKRPTRRHLALIAWGYSPDPKGLKVLAASRQENPLPALQRKATVYRVPLWIVEEVYARGLRQFRRAKTIPGNAYQWATTRVNRFLEGGPGSTRDGADRDLVKRLEGGDEEREVRQRNPQTPLEDQAAYRLSVAALPFGKRVGGDLYLHRTLWPSLPEGLQVWLEEAFEDAGVSGLPWDVLRLSTDSHDLSLLSYPLFFEEAFPVLQASWKVDLDERTATFTSYKDAKNPLILHRKETMIPKGHPAVATSARNTRLAEEAGCFQEASRIGRRDSWLEVLGEKGLCIREGRLEKKGISRQKNPSPSQLTPAQEKARAARNSKKKTIHPTAIRRKGLSLPFRALETEGWLEGQYSVFDYGCGRGFDVAALQRRGVEARGYDPASFPEMPLVRSDIVTLNYVLNVIPDTKERKEALLGAFGLAKRLLVVAVRQRQGGNMPQGTEEDFGDGVVTSKGTFQHYFTPKSLTAYIHRHLPGVSVEVLTQGEACIAFVALEKRKA